MRIEAATDFQQYINLPVEQKDRRPPEVKLFESLALSFNELVAVGVADPERTLAGNTNYSYPEANAIQALYEEYRRRSKPSVMRSSLLNPFQRLVSVQHIAKAAELSPGQIEEHLRQPFQFGVLAVTFSVGPDILDQPANSTGIKKALREIVIGREHPTQEFDWLEVSQLRIAEERRMIGVQDLVIV